MNGKDHPVTSYIPHFSPGTHFLDYSYVFPKKSLNGPTFSSFPDLPTSKKTGPQGKQMRMDHPFILGFWQNLTFAMVSTIIFPLLGKHPLS